MVDGSKKRALIGLVFGLLAAVFWLWPSEDRAIRRQLTRVEELASKAVVESTLKAALKVRQLSELCTDPCRIEVAAHQLAGDLSRQQLQQRLLLARGLYDQATVRWYDLTIQHQGHEAQVRGTLRIQGQSGGKPLADVQEVAGELVKIDGSWQIRAITLVAVLER